MPEIDCSLLWKYNLAKFYSDMIHEEQQMIDMGIDHNQKLHANIQELHQPFPQMAESSMGTSNLVHVFSKKVADEEEQELDYVNPFTEQNITRKTVNPMVEGNFSRMNQKNNSLISKMFLYLLIVYLFITLMTHLDGNIFLDLIIGLLLLSGWYFDIPRMIKNFVYKTMGGIIIAMIFDIIWLVFYHSPWWSTAYQDSYSLYRFRRYTVVMKYILIVVRILVLVGLGLVLSDIKKGDGTSEFQKDKPEKVTPSQIYQHKYNEGYDPAKSNTAYFDPHGGGGGQFPGLN